jgi:acyl-CoA thioesterase FadM
MERPKSIERTLITRGYEMNASGRIPVSTFLRYFEHTRWEAMADPHYDLRSYWQRGVIVAQKLEVLQHVGFAKALRVSAALARVGRTSLEFVHTMRLETGEKIARASTVAVNLGPTGPKPVPDGARSLVVDEVGPEVAPLEQHAPSDAWTRNVTVAYSDQDVLGHVNQARYVDYVEDTRAVAAKEGALGKAASSAVHKLWIEYARETTYGTELRILLWRLAGDSAVGCEIRRISDGEIVARARVEERADAHPLV